MVVKLLESNGEVLTPATGLPPDVATLNMLVDENQAFLVTPRSRNTETDADSDVQNLPCPRGNPGITAARFLRTRINWFRSWTGGITHDDSFPRWSELLGAGLLIRAGQPGAGSMRSAHL